MRSAPDTRQGLRSMRAAEIFKEKQGRRSASAARSSQPQSPDLFERSVLISPAAPSSFEPSDPVSFARLLCVSQDPPSPYQAARSAHPSHLAGPLPSGLHYFGSAAALNPASSLQLRHRERHNICRFPAAAPGLLNLIAARLHSLMPHGLTA